MRHCSRAASALSFALAGVAAAGCSPGATEAAPQGSGLDARPDAPGLDTPGLGADAAAAVANAPGAEAADPCAAATREGGALRWFHDDYGAALACARSKSLPLMIDMWAPWCHTCLSMQAYVLTDERLADYDRRYVFVALDTDREVNAATVAAFPPAAWPTFFAISSVDETIQSRFVGAATVTQFAQFLDDGERGHQAAAGVLLAAHESAARDGDRAAARKQWGAAIDAYGQALAVAPAGWPRAPDVKVSLLVAHNRDHSWAACPAIVRAHLGSTDRSASASDFGHAALVCADGQTDAAIATALRDAVVAHFTAFVDDAAAPLSIDDRSDALMYLRQALGAVGRKPEALAAAGRQRALLDTAVRDAADPRVTMTYNWPRAEVYAYLGVPLELVPALERSAKDLPDEYDPPYRLAWIYLQAHQPEQARAWAEKAAALAYGPRKAKAFGLLADVHRARGDVEGERGARAAAIEVLEGLPEPARSAEPIAKARAELAAVGAG